MRNKKNFITTPKNTLEYNPNDLVTVVIFEQNNNQKLKSSSCPFIKVHGKPLLEKQIEAAQSIFKNLEVIVCSGSNSLKILKYIKSKFKTVNVRVVENTNIDTTNCCESLRLALTNTVNDKVIILPEDILLTNNHFQSLNMTKSCILVQDQNIDGNLFVSAITENDKLEHMSIGLKNNYWSEIFFVNGEKNVSDFHDIISVAEFKNKLIFEAINVFAKKIEIDIIKTNRPITKIDSTKILKRISVE